LAFIPQLTVNLNPTQEQRSLQLSYTVADASPQQVEKLATAPLENVLSQLRDLDEINSVSRYNQGNISLEFAKQADLNYKRFELASLLRQVYPSLDPSVSYPQIGAVKEEAQERDILTYSLSAPMAAYRIKEVVEETILRSVQSESGVEAVQVYGATPMQIGVYYDPQKLQAYGFTEQDLRETLQKAGNIQYPGVTRVSAGQYVGIVADQRFHSINELRQLPITKASGESITVGKIAQLVQEEQLPTAYHRINAKNFITLSITARQGVNRIQLARKLKEQIAKAEVALPAAYDLRMVYDDTDFLEKEMDKLYSRSLLSIAILVCFIFFINRNWRYLLVLFAGIVVNCCLAILGVWAFDIQIHLYSLAGLTISFGLIVDNAIVMIDHLHRYKNKHLFLALFAASLTTIAALLLVFLLPEAQQANLLDFTKIVALLLAVSLLVGLFFTPALYTLLFSKLKADAKKRSTKSLRRRVKAFLLYSSFIQWNARFKKLWYVVLILLFGTPVFLLPAKWEDHTWYNNVIGSDVYQENIRPITDPILGGSLRLFVRNVYERSSYRKKEKTRLFVNAKLPYGNTLEQMNDIIINIEEYLSQQEGIGIFTTNIYSGQYASIEIVFKEAFELSSYPYQLKARLSAKSTNWSGVDWSIYGVGQGFSTGSGDRIPSFRVALRGYNYDELARQAQWVGDELLKHPRIQEVNTNERLSWRDEESQEYVLSPQINQLAQQGINLATFVNTIRKQAPANGFVNRLDINGTWWPVKLQANTAHDFNKYAIENKSYDYQGERVPIASLSQLKLQATSNALYKENRNYIRVLSFEYYGSGRFGDKYLKEVLAAYEQVKPLGYTAEKQSFSWSSEETKKQYGLLLILIIAIFFICSILFESFRLPFYILLLIPIAFVGLFLTFGVFEFYFDQGGYAAFVMLGGLTVNAGIYILYDFQQRRIQNNRSFLKAVSYKATPILLTIFSTCFGLVPFIIGGQNEVFWFSLAAGTIGGLLLSMIGVFFFLPMMAIRKRAA
jgi:multidrug efflux pump subunit AcrB